jgi:serine/threonine-protein phosphatase 5
VTGCGYICLKLSARISRATCYLQIAKPQLAVADFKKVVALEPRNTIVQSQLTATQKLVRRIEFEKVCLTLQVYVAADIMGRRLK